MDKKTTRKNQIIDASINVMYLKGYNGTSVKDITDAAGIPKGSFYNYFKDKEHYAVDAINYYFSELVNGYISKLRNQDLDSLDRIREFFSCGIFWLDQQDITLGCFVGNMTQEMGNNSKLISEVTAKIHSELESMIYENLVEAHANKVLKTELNLKTLASFILSSWQGSILRMKETYDRKMLDVFYTVVSEGLLKKVF